jgi:hypothetical protein
MIEDHLLQEKELGDRVKVACVVQKLVITGLGLPDRPWHEWDDWVKGLEWSMFVTPAAQMERAVFLF